MFNLHVLAAALAARSAATSRTVWTTAAAGAAADDLASFAAAVDAAAGGRLKLTLNEAPFEAQELLRALQAGRLQAGAVTLAELPADGDAAPHAIPGCVLLLRGPPHAVFANQAAFEALDASLQQALRRLI